MRDTLRQAMIACLVLLAIGPAACGRPEPEVPRMSAAEAFARHGDPDTVFVDVRTGRTWMTSALKIAGAVREDPEAVDAWAGSYEARQTIVCYCT